MLILIDKAAWNGSPIYRNGRKLAIKPDVPVEVTDSEAQILRNARIPFEEVATGAETGRYVIPKRAGTRFPVSINGRLQYFTAGVALSLSASQIALLQGAGVPLQAEKQLSGGSPTPGPTPTPGPPYAAGIPIYFEGDSNTAFTYQKLNWAKKLLAFSGGRAWVPPGGWPAWAGSTINTGNNQMVQRHATLLANLAQYSGPKIVWFQIGTNPDTDTAAALVELGNMIADWRAAGAIVVANTCPYNQGGAGSNRFDQINNWLRTAGRVDYLLDVQGTIVSEMGAVTHYTAAQGTSVGQAGATLLATFVSAGEPYATNASPYFEDLFANFAAGSGSGWSGDLPQNWQVQRSSGTGSLVATATTQNGHPALKMAFTGGSSGFTTFRIYRTLAVARSAGDIVDAYARIAIAGRAPAPGTVVPFVGIEAGNGNWPNPSLNNVDIPFDSWAGPLIYRAFAEPFVAAANHDFAIRVVVAANQTFDVIVSEPEMAVRGSTSAVAPAALTAPTMGNATAGQTLSHSAGTYSGTPTPTIGFTYYLDDTAIAASYVLQAGDVGKAVTVRESAGNIAGSNEQVSGAVTVQASGGGDTTAPTITSTNTLSVAENALLGHALTANETVTWTVRSEGQNAASVDSEDFEISGSTLRWTGNGTKDFEAPTDDSSPTNTYVVVVRATDAASNSTDQTITVTVTDVAEGGVNSGWNEAITASGVTYPSPNILQNTGTNVRTSRSEVAHTSGKRFAVIAATSGGTSAIGIGSSAVANGNNAATVGGNGTDRVVWFGSLLTATGGNVTGQAAVDDGVAVQIAVDIDADLIWFRKGSGNWNANASANPATGVGGASMSGPASPIYLVAALKATGPYQATLYTTDTEFASLGIAKPTGFVAWE